jgi:hypothetical protein
MSMFLIIFLTICGTALGAASITTLLCKLLHNSRFAQLGGVIPACGVVAYFLRRESVEPLAPFSPFVGAAMALLSIIVGIAVAAVVTTEMRGRAQNPD